MIGVWWLLIVATSAAAKSNGGFEINEFANSSNIEKTKRERGDFGKKMLNYTLQVGRWSECKPLDVVTFEIISTDRISEAALIHTPVLGVQKRQVQCLNKTGDYDEPTICKIALTQFNTERLCILKKDCVLAKWLPWQVRSDGALVRLRRITQLPQGGGKECDVVQEIKPLAMVSTARWYPDRWGPCHVAYEIPTTVSPTQKPDDDDDDEDDDVDDTIDDIESTDGNVYESIESKASRGVSCGGGAQRRDVICVRDNFNELHPAYCAHAPMPTLVQPCEVPCPRDCEVGEWSEWGACQPTDGCPLFPVQQLTTTGYSVRHRRVISSASGGGAACPPLEEKRSCSTPRCATWKALPWGPCVLSQPHTICGPGKRSRELRCVGHDGKEAQRGWCSGTGAPARSERCRIACAGDCVVSSWGPWSACSAPCLDADHPQPTRTRRRHILAHASPNGWPCPPEDELVQNETCNNHACATYSWLATPWSPCERQQDYTPDLNYTIVMMNGPITIGSDYDTSTPCIEEGKMVRDVMCVQNNADLVRNALCAPLKRPVSHRACTKRCDRDCRVGPWMPWSPCPKTCKPGKQVRERIVKGNADCEPREETRVCEASRSNCASTVAWSTDSWSLCNLPPGHTCGIGYMVRSVWCGLGSRRVEPAECAGQRLPPTVAECTIPCAEYGRINTYLDCNTVCSNPLKFLDNFHELRYRNCSCSNLQLEILPSDSDCILPPENECGVGKTLKAARCLYEGKDVPMEVCKKFYSLKDRHRKPCDHNKYDNEFPSLISNECTVECARDCVLGAWGEWGPCAAEPGSKTAYRFRTREVINEGLGGGRECGSTLQRATCIVSDPRWALGEWSMCAPPRSLCGSAIINRTVTCVDAEGNVLDDGTCEASGAGPAPSRETTCRAPCPGDCVVSSWSEWSPCEQTKWGGRRDRTRVVLRPAEEGGAACPPLVGAEPCAPRAHSWHVAPWDDCQPLGGSPCGEGIKKRAVRCLRSDGIFVNDSFCPNTTAAEARESWCYVPCGVDCDVSAWGPWDTSACTCGDVSTPQHMRRTRQHLTTSVWPGRACPPTEQKVPCPREPCLRLVARPSLGCNFETVSGTEARNVCGVGVKLSQVRCELTSVGNVLGYMYLHPWRCINVPPGRIVVPPLAVQKDGPCSLDCGCKNYEERPGQWGAWSACVRGSRSRTRQAVVLPRAACNVRSRHITIEWANCSVELNDTRDLPTFETSTEQGVYHNGYMEGSTSLVAVVWIATIILSLYGAYMLYRGCIGCLSIRKRKMVTKV